MAAPTPEERVKTRVTTRPATGQGDRVPTTRSRQRPRHGDTTRTPDDAAARVRERDRDTPAKPSSSTASGIRRQTPVEYNFANGPHTTRNAQVTTSQQRGQPTTTTPTQNAQVRYRNRQADIAAEQARLIPRSAAEDTDTQTQDPAATTHRPTSRTRRTDKAGTAAYRSIPRQRLGAEGTDPAQQSAEARDTTSSTTYRKRPQTPPQTTSTRAARRRIETAAREQQTTTARAEKQAAGRWIPRYLFIYWLFAILPFTILSLPMFGLLGATSTLGEYIPAPLVSSVGYVVEEVGEIALDTQAGQAVLAALAGLVLFFWGSSVFFIIMPLFVAVFSFGRKRVHCFGGKHVVQKSLLFFWAFLAGITVLPNLIFPWGWLWGHYVLNHPD